MTHTHQFDSLFTNFVSGTLNPEAFDHLFQHFGESGEPALLGLIGAELHRDEREETLEDEEEAQQLEKVYSKIHKRIQQNVRENRGRRFIHLHTLCRYAACIILIAGLCWLAKCLLDKWDSRKEWKKVATRYERKKVTFSDGTVIWLSPQTTLEYPEAFASDLREVHLKGEAFFEVTKDPKRPFTIQSGALTTRVLGTSFHVNAYPEEESAKVTVLTGSVSVALSKSTDRVTLAPFEQAVFQKNKKILTRQAYPEAAEMLDRREGNIHYEGTSLADVIRDVQRRSNWKISAGSNLDECVFYGEMKAGDDPIAFLENVCRVNNLLLNKHHQSRITITGKSCRKNR